MKALMINPNKNILTNKMRDQMYLKHLREVEKINNREPESLKKQLKQYKSISQIHNKYKVRAKDWQNLELQRLIQQKNKAITDKVKSIKSVFNFGRPKTINPLLTQSKQQVFDKLNKSQEQSHSQIAKNIKQLSKEINQSLNKSIAEQKKRQAHSQSHKQHSFHYRYRKRQQQLIQQQNQRIVKAIMSQRSCIDSPKKGLHSLLPHINGGSSRYQVNRSITSNSANYSKNQIEKNMLENQNNEKDKNKQQI